ncbi:MAG: winged helix-turn-helix domain-containing protein [Candidatus Edwardsbacteria bacterium]
MKIIEKRFRGSLVCRVLGYPISYGITKLLLERGRTDLNTIAGEVKRSKSAVCFHLTKLRLANIIRYERTGKITYYWIKYPKEIKKLFDSCESLVKRISRRLEKDL